MASTINIPKLGVSVTEGKLAEWLVADGDVITAGQALYVLETDKVETEIEAPCAGTIRLIGTAGETYEVGTLVAEVH